MGFCNIKANKVSEKGIKKEEKKKGARKIIREKKANLNTLSYIILYNIFL